MEPFYGSPDGLVNRESAEADLRIEHGEAHGAILIAGYIETMVHSILSVEDQMKSSRPKDLATYELPGPCFVFPGGKPKEPANQGTGLVKGAAAISRDRRIRPVQDTGWVLTAFPLLDQAENDRLLLLREDCPSQGKGLNGRCFNPMCQAAGPAAGHAFEA